VEAPDIINVVNGRKISASGCVKKNYETS